MNIQENLKDTSVLEVEVMNPNATGVEKLGITDKRVEELYNTIKDIFKSNDEVKDLPDLLSYGSLLANNSTELIMVGTICMSIINQASENAKAKQELNKLAAEILGKLKNKPQ